MSSCFLVELLISNSAIPSSDYRGYYCVCVCDGERGWRRMCVWERVWWREREGEGECVWVRGRESGSVLWNCGWLLVPAGRLESVGGASNLWYCSECRGCKLGNAVAGLLVCLQWAWYTTYPGNLGVWDLSDFLFVSAFSSQSIDRITRLRCLAALQLGVVGALPQYH